MARAYVGRVLGPCRFSVARAVPMLGGVELATLPPRHDLANHSPDGFAWGYGGSGPAQLALALLADALGSDERALAIYQRFKEAVIARLPMDEGFTLELSEVMDIAEAIEGGSDGEAG